MMQLFADSESLKADIKAMKDSWAKWYDIKQKEYELSQIERRIKWRDYASVKTQCEQYFIDNTRLFDKNTIINETRAMLSRGQTVNEWPHLAAVFLLDHAAVGKNTKVALQTIATVPAPVAPAPVAPAPVVPTPTEQPPVVLWPPADPIPAPTRGVDGHPEGPRYPSRQGVAPRGAPPVPDSVESPSALAGIVPILQDIPKPHELFLTLAVEAIRDEVREAKNFDSFRWSNKKEKAEFVQKIAMFVKNLPGKDPKASIEEIHTILKDAREKRIISKDQYSPILDLYNMRSDMSRLTPDTYRDIAIRAIRASNGTTQMHSIFYGHFKVDIDLKITQFTQAQQDKINNEVLRIMGKMNAQLTTLARTEWENNQTEIKMMNPDINSVHDYLKLLVDNYTKAITHDLQGKQAIKLIWEDGFKSQDAKLWEHYNDAVDPMDKWFTISDESATSIATFVAYDLTSLLISGGAAWVIGRGAAWAGRWVLGAARVAKITQGAGVVSGWARTLGAVARAGVEWFSFTALHTFVRDQQWFYDQPDWNKQVVINSLGFWLFRSAQSGSINKMFAGIENKSVQGLVKMGLVVPAIMTGIQIGVFDYDRLRNLDPGLIDDHMSTFVLMAALGGMFHRFWNPGTRLAKVGDRLNIVETNAPFKSWFIQLQNQRIPMRVNQDSTITLTVKWKWWALQDVTFKPSKDLQKQLDIKVNPPQTPSNNPTSPSAWPRATAGVSVWKFAQYDGPHVFSSRADVTQATHTTSRWRYEYAFFRDNWEIKAVRRIKWAEQWDDFNWRIPKGVSSIGVQLNNLSTGSKLSQKNYDDFIDDIWKFDKKSPDTRQLGDMVVTYDKALKRITVKKWQESEKIFTSKDDFKRYIMSQDESVVAATMRSNRQTPKFESQWNVWTDKYLLTKEGKFYKNGTEMKLEDLWTLSWAETQKLFSVLYEAKGGRIFADTVASKFTSGAKGTLDGTWYIASTPWKTNWFMSIPAFFVNIVRLPFINLGEVYRTVMTSWMTNTQKFKDILKTLAFANKNGFDGFINGSITTITTAAILYSQYMFVQEKQAKWELPGDMSWTWEAWEVTKSYLISNNITLPYDIWLGLVSPRK